MTGWVYMMASKPFGTLYTGVTSTLVARVFQHREGVFEGFTKRYGVDLLVYYEEHASITTAIQREKNIKHWPRAWKVALVQKVNPEWRDLFNEIAHG